jgi:hypothetical protein
VNYPPAQLSVSEELDRVNAAPLDLGRVRRGSRLIAAPDMGDVAEQVDASAGFDLVEVVRHEERRGVRLIFVQRHRQHLRAALIVDPGADLPRFGQEAVRLAAPVARTPWSADHRVHLVDDGADLLFVSHASAFLEGDQVATERPPSHWYL